MMYFQRYRLSLPGLQTTFFAMPYARCLLVMFPESPRAFVRRIDHENLLIRNPFVRFEPKSNVPTLPCKMRYIHLIIRDNTIDRSVIASNWSKPQLSQNSCDRFVFGHGFPDIIECISNFTHNGKVKIYSRVLQIIISKILSKSLVSTIPPPRRWGTKILFFL